MKHWTEYVGERLHIEEKLLELQTKLSEAQTQLAAEQKMADIFADFLGCLAGRAVLTPTKAKMSISIEEYRGLFLYLTKYQATRQPTQDKGAADEQA